MAQYDPITGHTISKAKFFLEDDYWDETPRDYTVNCDDIVSYRVTATSIGAARAEARRLYRADSGGVNPRLCIATLTGASA